MTSNDVKKWFPCIWLLTYVWIIRDRVFDDRDSKALNAGSVAIHCMRCQNASISDIAAMRLSETLSDLRYMVLKKCK